MIVLPLGGGFAVEALFELEAGALGAGFDFPELEVAALAQQGQVGGPPQMGFARSVHGRRLSHCPVFERGELEFVPPVVGPEVLNDQRLNEYLLR